MNTVISATLISVLGAGLIGMLFHYLRDLSTKVTGGFQALGERIDRVYDVLLDNGERLTRLEEAVKGNSELLGRIEDMLGVDPPAEAA